MSGLYNMLFGRNPAAAVILALLGTDSSRVPRFRDAYVDEEGHLCIFTRTGGGNREYYEDAASRKSSDSEAALAFAVLPDLEGPYNEDLRKLPGYVSDADSDFDSTYAVFKYDYPDKDVVAKLIAMGAQATDPMTKFRELITALQSGEQTEQTKHALEVGKNIFGKIEEAFKQEQPTVVLVGEDTPPETKQ